LYVGRAAAHWVRRDRSIPGSVSVSGIGCLNRPFPRVQMSPGSSTRSELRFRVPSLKSRSAPHGAELLPGFSPLFATSPKRVNQSQGLPNPCSVPSPGVLNLSTVFLRAPACRLVSSRSRVQGLCSSRGFSLRAAAASSSETACPHAVARPSLGWANPSGHEQSTSASRP
jgi:hypothetical protein